MSIMQFLVTAVLTICAVIGFIKVLDLIFDTVEERLNRKAYREIEIGSRWESKRNPDPWSQRARIEIIDKRDGWVRYTYEHSSIDWTMKARNVYEDWNPLP